MNETRPSSSERTSDAHARLQRVADTHARSPARGFRAGVGLENIARRTLGIALLLVTVLLWTASNFLASYIFADNTYSKPYFVTYFNTSFFAISLLPILIRNAGSHKTLTRRELLKGWWKDLLSLRLRPSSDHPVASARDITADEPLLTPDGTHHAYDARRSLDWEHPSKPGGMLNFRETAVLSFEFCLLWFAANYFVAACLEYTSVASSTILTSTSSIWTLMFGAFMKVEKFTVKKLMGVLVSFSGIILISMVDLNGDNDENRGNFPHKSQQQIAIGNTLAFVSAILYGLYSIVMKKRVENEDRVNMPLFFGLVGFFNVIFLWPGFIILHLTGVETFELPPTGKIWTIIILNSLSSFVSDYSWAYAMLLTTPLVVTVGLSLTIPLSLVGQMLLSSQYASAVYWLGAVAVVLSFLFINHESHEMAEEIDRLP